MTQPSPASTVAAVDQLMPQVHADLAELVTIPSVNFPGYDTAPVLACADACARMLQEAGATVQLLPGDRDVPTVHAVIPGPPGAPTVLLYSHYDVQPGGDPAAWTSPAFTPELRDGRLYGRGAADDKSGVVTHLACARALAGDSPVTLRILLEGEEEFGGAFETWPGTRPELFAGADAVVVNDMGPAELGLPTFTTALRGIVGGVVSTRTVREPLHSGVFGGPTPDALMVLIKLLATLIDDRGDCAIEGLQGGTWSGAEMPEDMFRALAGFEPGIPLIGSGSIASRLYARSSVTVLGVDAPDVATSPNAIIPEARAKISVRIPPGVSADSAAAALRSHVERHAPWGVPVAFELQMAEAGAEMPTDGPAFAAFSGAMVEAYGRDPVVQGVGGSIPFVAHLHEAFPDVEILGVGAQDPAARIHAPNESVDLAELRRSITAELLFLQRFGRSS